MKRTNAEYLIAFVVVGGGKQGLGHIMRCAALAEAATHRGHQTLAVLGRDPGSHAVWQRASGGCRTLAAKVFKESERPGLLVIDLPHEASDWLTWARSQSIPTVVLDQHRHLREADLTICPALHEPPSESHSLLAGPKWNILARPHRWPHPGAIKNKLLVSLGGADPYRAALQIAPVIAKIFDQLTPHHGFQTREVVLGPAFSDPDQRAAGALKAAGWTVHIALEIEAMAALMANSRLAISGFGTSLVELAAHRTPHLSIAHRRSDLSHAHFLESQGIGRSLGFAGDLDLDHVAKLAYEAMTDQRWQRESAQYALDAISEGYGIERVLDQFESLAAKSMKSSLDRCEARTLGGP